MLMAADTLDARKSEIEYMARKLYSQFGYYRTERQYEQALKNIEFIDNMIALAYGENSKEYSAFLNELGSVYYNTAAYMKAKEKFEKGYDIDRKIIEKKYPSFMEEVDDLAELNIELVDQTEGPAKLSYDIPIGIVDPAARLGVDIENLSAIEQKLGNIPKALRMAHQAAQIFRIVSRVDLGRCLKHLADLYVEIGDTDKAQAYYDASLGIKQEMSNKRGSR